MPVTAKIQVHGIKEAIERLRSLEPKLAKKVVRKAIKNAAQPILHAARSKAPVDKGLLVSTLRVKAGSSRREGALTARVETKDGDYKGEAFYASFIEYGYRKADGTVVPPDPFMRPAFDEQKENALAIFTQEMREGVEREAQT